MCVLDLSGARQWRRFRVGSNKPRHTLTLLLISTHECAGSSSCPPACPHPHTTPPTGKHVLLKVQKRPGKESESLLPAADAVSTDSKAAAKKKKDYGTINVFTVASGHMYERLQKIMILSVIKNTKSK